VAEAACTQDDRAVDHQPDCIEHGRKDEDLERHRTRMRLNELREQREDEQRHLRVQQVREQSLPEQDSDGVPRRTRSRREGYRT